MRNLNVIYSIGVRFADLGIGQIAYHAVRGIYAAGFLKKLIAISYAPTEIPAHLISSCKLLWLIKDSRKREQAFDYLASGLIAGCDVFHGWNHYSLRSMRKAKKRGAVTVIDRASTHPVFSLEVLAEEFEKYGLDSGPLAASVARCMDELHETDVIIVPSQFVLDTFLEKGFDCAKIRMVPFGVDIRKFYPADKPPEKFRVLFIGTLGPRKGLQYVLEAWDRLRLKDAELILVGPIQQGGEKLLSRYRHLQNIQLTGLMPELADIYRRASVFLFPSLEEGSAMVTYEAMASGLPVILSTNTGSFAVDGEDGFIIPIRDVEAIMEKVEFLYRNPERGLEMGASGRKRIAEYTWQRYGRALVDVYRESVSREAS
ncbi:MAG: glycosyltransferase family 4 protein [Desulfobacterales bacterium]|nr:MAG: glycosyltransferase family 4 protein [Desulfobacterales bacterium]